MRIKVPIVVEIDIRSDKIYSGHNIDMCYFCDEACRFLDRNYSGEGGCLLYDCCLDMLWGGVDDDGKAFGPFIGFNRCGQCVDDVHKANNVKE